MLSKYRPGFLVFNSATFRLWLWFFALISSIKKGVKNVQNSLQKKKRIYSALLEVHVFILSQAIPRWNVLTMSI